MNVLSLCSSIGGLDKGLEDAGMIIVAQVEKDPLRRSVLRRHWPHVPQHDDLTTFTEWWQQEDRPHVDLVAGGIPCQPFSNPGFKRGVSDERWLWPAMADAIRLVRPRFVLLENVAALLANRDAFGWILADLAALGFDAEWSVLPACAMGAPHPRERLLLVAYANGVMGQPRVGSGQGFSLARGTWRSRESERVRAEARAWRDRVDRAVAASVASDRDADGLAAELVAAGEDAVVPQVAQHVGELIMEAAS